MSGIQIILLTALFSFALWIYIKDFVPWLKILAWLFVVAGAYFVILPEQANELAHLLKVGRGADLMLYFFVVIFTFYGIAMYQKMKNLERLLTILFREKAKKEGRYLGEEKNAP